MTAPDRNLRETNVDNPLRSEERRRVRDEVTARLRHRGATLEGSESDEELLALANAVDAFERAVMQSGGDLMVDTPESSQPDNPEHVLPRRRADERADAYARRIHDAADRVGMSR
jgi:hypothetical protein